MMTCQQKMMTCHRKCHDIHVQWLRPQIIHRWQKTLIISSNWILCYLLRAESHWLHSEIYLDFNPLGKRLSLNGLNWAVNISSVRNHLRFIIDRTIRAQLTLDIDRNWTVTGNLCGTNLCYCSWRIMAISLNDQVIQNLQVCNAIKIYQYYDLSFIKLTPLWTKKGRKVNIIM